VRARLVVAVIVFVAACSGGAPVRQPIDFSHAIHVGEQDVPCTDCHVGAETGTHATLPALSRCLLCHMKPQAREGEAPDPREHLVRELAAADEPVRWTQVTRNAGHVYFSHRAHVTLAGISCRDCHGDVATWTTPPTEPEPRLTSMQACLACHREEGAPTSCDTCHQ
jgi:c(7)-type cytochrome triheme protein